MVMPTNNGSGIIHYLAGKYPGSVGWLMSPDGWRQPVSYMPYALDNGAFKDFDASAYRAMLSRTRFCKHSPLWVVVPDVMADCNATLALWHEWENELTGFKLAFVCQDGQEPETVPLNAYCCFIGGTTRWKLDNAYRFKGVRPWLHVGRVNTWRRLHWAEEIGADSCDGTGFFRGDKAQKQSLIDFVQGQRQGGLWHASI